MQRWLGVWAGLLLSVSAGRALAADESTPKIRDNLFLLEEAYNQEPGVIQHIQAFVLDPDARGWGYTFTEEWPMPTDTHQLSVTLGWARAGRDAPTQFGDMMVNYRFQAVNTGALALAPRLSLMIPTGDAETGGGRGGAGLQLGLPVSIELTDSLVAHLNAGVTLTPTAKAPGGRSASAFDASAGGALVYLATSWANAFVEVLGASVEEVGDAGSERVNSFTVNPAVRFAWNVTPELQVVPGLAAPIAWEGGDRSLSLLVYLSIEHVLWHPAPTAP